MLMLHIMWCSFDFIYRAVYAHRFLFGHGSTAVTVCVPIEMRACVCLCGTYKRLAGSRCFVSFSCQI